MQSAKRVDVSAAGGAAIEALAGGGKGAGIGARSRFTIKLMLFACANGRQFTSSGDKSSGLP